MGAPGEDGVIRGSLDYCQSCMAMRGCSEPCEDCNAPEINPEDQVIITVFQRVKNQSRVIFSPGYCLDYGAVAALLAGLRIPQTADLWNGLQTIESAIDRINAAHDSNH